MKLDAKDAIVVVTLALQLFQMSPRFNVLNETYLLRISVVLHSKWKKHNNDVMKVLTLI